MSPPLLLRLGVVLAILHLSLALSCIRVLFQNVEELRNKKEEASSKDYKGCYWQARMQGNCTHGFGLQPQYQLGGFTHDTGLGKCTKNSSVDGLYTVKCSCKGDNCNEDMERFDRMLGTIRQTSQLHCLRGKLGTLNSQLKQQAKTEKTLWIILGVVGVILGLVIILICICCIRGYFYAKKEEEKMEQNLKNMEEEGTPVVVAYDAMTGGTTYFLVDGKKTAKNIKKKMKDEDKSTKTEKSQKSKKSKKTDKSQKSSKTTLTSQMSQKSKKSQKSQKSVTSTAATKTDMKSGKSTKPQSKPESPKKEAAAVASVSLSKEHPEPSKE